MELFKGQFDYETLFYKFSYKKLDSLRTAREKRLKKENEQLEAQMKQNQQKQIRSEILRKQ